MEFSVTEEQRLLRQTVQEFVAKEIAPHVEAWEEKGDVPDAVFRKLGAIGLLGAPVPTEYGGAGLDAVTYAMLASSAACAMPTAPAATLSRPPLRILFACSQPLPGAPSMRSAGIAQSS